MRACQAQATALQLWQGIVELHSTGCLSDSLLLISYPVLLPNGKQRDVVHELRPITVVAQALKGIYHGSGEQSASKQRLESRVSLIFGLRLTRLQVLATRPHTLQ